MNENRTNDIGSSLKSSSDKRRARTLKNSSNAYSHCWITAPLYWSTIQYARLWQMSDGVWVRQIASAGGMTSKTLRAIDIAYNVNRGVVAAKIEINNHKFKTKTDKAAHILCDLLNAEQRTWPVHLNERAQHCINITKKAQESGCFHTLQVSAVTKFMWFLQPDGWTPFDRFAAAGMGLRGAAATHERMNDFYMALQKAEFGALTQKMQNVIDSTPLHGLPATRIVDVHLMARGGRGADDESVQASRFFLDLALPDTRAAVEALASQLQDTFGDTYKRLTSARIP